MVAAVFITERHAGRSLRNPHLRRNGTDESVPYNPSSTLVVATDVSRETSVTAQETARHLVNNTAINNTTTATATHGDTHTRHPWHAGRTVTTRLQEHPMPHSPFFVPFYVGLWGIMQKHGFFVVIVFINGTGNPSPTKQFKNSLRLLSGTDESVPYNITHCLT